MDFLLQNFGILSATALLLLAVLFWKFFLWLFGVIIVPDDSIGTVTKKFVLFGSHRNLPDGQIVALNGEAGCQADSLPQACMWDCGLGNTPSSSSGSL